MAIIKMYSYYKYLKPFNNHVCNNIKIKFYLTKHNLYYIIDELVEKTCIGVSESVLFFSYDEERIVLDALLLCMRTEIIKCCEVETTFDIK